MRLLPCLILSVITAFTTRTWLAPASPEAQHQVRLGRRRVTALVSAGAGLSSSAEAKDLLVEEPLIYCGGGFCAAFRLGGQLFRGVVDTGSPFLLVSTCEGDSCASYCRAWGCTSGKAGEPSGLKDTDELFAAGLARVSWKRGSLALGNLNFGSVTYGAMLEVESYGGNGGGAFLGLVRDKSPRIRPTLLGQTSVRTVTVDLRSPGQERLLLSGGAPAAGTSPAATALRVAGQPVDLPTPLVAVLDTGTTGLGLPSAIFESYDQLRRDTAQEFGLQKAQAVDLLLRAEDGSEFALSMRPGRQKTYGQDRFDIVTALPEPSGMNADASALWTGQGLSDAQPMQLRDGNFIAQAPTSSVGWAQADRPVSQGDRFLVRLLPSGPGRLPCNGSVGLAPRGARLTQDMAAYGTSEGKLQPGDLVECRLADDGSGEVSWRVNGKEAISSQRTLSTARMVYPTVELSAGCDAELLSSPLGSSMDEGQQGMGWAKAPEGAKAKKKPPTVLFLGLGFLLGRQVSIDTVANRAIFA
ncbi:unnamed protein product [Durusdinium trenchii]|uniref:Peptidase A1 domain-containing protein n=1 Tax=Durusdinium trenchii TaxID=1381693 RepID=A0ABP0HJR9_9DINO